MSDFRKDALGLALSRDADLPQAAVAAFLCHLAEITENQKVLLVVEDVVEPPEGMQNLRGIGVNFSSEAFREEFIGDYGEKHSQEVSRIFDAFAEHLPDNQLLVQEFNALKQRLHEPEISKELHEFLFSLHKESEHRGL